MNGSIFSVPYRRKREGKTDYKRRLALLLSNKPRLVVRRSVGNMNAQVIIYSQAGDKVVVCANSSELKKFGWNYGGGNMPAAYLTGLLIGKKASKKGVKDAILDLGLQKSVPRCRIYATLKGAVDAGMKVPHSQSILPDDKRIKGEHIKAYAEVLKKKSKDAYDKAFSGLMKAKADPSAIVDKFNDAKKKILEA